MKPLLLQTHYSAEEAYSLLIALDNLRDSLWQNYREDIIEYCRQQDVVGTSIDTDLIDDKIPF